jgi:hypothetical protein
MEPANSPEMAAIKRVAAVYNQLINFFWTILTFGPIGYFCYVAMPPSWLYGFIVSSVLPFFLPASFFQAIQLGRTTAIYHKLGLRTVRKYTQDGLLVHRLIRRQYAFYNPVRTASIKAHLSKAATNERFHLSVFVFFLLATIYALVAGYWGWALVISISNLVYNVYPILLQQYNRIRFQQLADRREVTQKSGT